MAGSAPPLVEPQRGIVVRDTVNAFVAGSTVHIDGKPGGTLAGLTFAAKDLFDIAGHPTGGGMDFFDVMARIWPHHSTRAGSRLPMKRANARMAASL